MQRYLLLQSLVVRRLLTVTLGTVLSLGAVSHLTTSHLNASPLAGDETKIGTGVG